MNRHVWNFPHFGCWNLRLHWTPTFQQVKDPFKSINILFWLVVSNIFYIFPIILGIMIPIDFHIFQRGGSTTNQYLNVIQFHQKSHGKSIWISDSSKFHSNTIYRSLTKILSKITWNHIKSENKSHQTTIFPTSTSGSPRIFAAFRLHGGRGPRARTSSRRCSRGATRRCPPSGVPSWPRLRERSVAEEKWLNELWFIVDISSWGL